MNKLKTTIVTFLLVTSSITIFAQPVKSARYDDADDYLPKAEQRNKNNIRLFLRQQDGEELIKVTSPRNVTVDLIAKIPADAEYAVIFLLGGTSVLSIANEKLDRSFSFQPRSRDYWWDQKFATFLVDAPSDRLGKDGIQDTVWRTGKDHLTDLEAVLNTVAARFKGPIIIHGHSNGAASLANMAQLNSEVIKAYVYSGAAFLNKGAEITSRVEHKAPVLVVHHKNDLCTVSPFSRDAQFADSIKATEKKTLWIDGGIDAMSGQCGPFAAHSFVGREESTISEIAKQVRIWLKK